MKRDDDTLLLRLFEIAAAAAPGDAFVAEVMAHIEALRRRSVVIWCLVGLAIAVAGSLVAAPLVDSARLAAEVLPGELLEIDNSWLRQLVSPVNTIAGAIAIGALLIRAAYKRLVG